MHICLLDKITNTTISTDKTYFQKKSFVHPEDNYI